MPYVIPTPSQVRDRYPEFQVVVNSIINSAINDAARFVDLGWFEDDYQRAIMALAAHIMVTDGATGMAINTTGSVVSEKLGDASITYGGANGGSSGDLSGTAYGRAFLRIQRVNVPAISLI